MTRFGIVLLGVLLALAVYTDARRHRIPNSLNLAGLVAALLLAGLTGGVAGALDSLTGAAIGGAMLLPFYLMHGLGAGDVKLMAVAGAFLGPQAALLAACLALVSGAIIALAFVGVRVVRPGGLLQGSVLKQHFPYAAAIAVGVLASLWQAGALRLSPGVPGIS